MPNIQTSPLGTLLYFLAIILFVIFAFLFVSSFASLVIYVFAFIVAAFVFGIALRRYVF
jgi:hypothetical protein